VRAFIKSRYQSCGLAMKEFVALFAIGSALTLNLLLLAFLVLPPNVYPGPSSAIS
jgi:hypothetical protein